jgi:hypothetical protein
VISDAISWHSPKLTMSQNVKAVNEQPLTPTPWRRLHPQLRTELRQILGGKQAILNRPVLDIARMLCAREAYLLAWHLYQGLDGQPFTPYQSCGLGLLMDLRSFMGEDPAEIGATILL